MVWWVIGGLGASVFGFLGWSFREICREVNDLYEKSV